MADAVFLPTQATAEARYFAIFGTRTRFVVMVLVLFCLTSIWSNILTFNFAVICMGPKEITSGNGTSFDNYDSYEFSKFERSWAISVVAIAALLGNFPVVHLVNVIGIRTVFAGLGLLSAISTLLLPTAIRLGLPFLLIARACQGLAFAANFPVIGSFCAKWTYFKQNGLFVSALVAYVQLAPAFTMPASGALCETFRWPSVFYAHGAVSLLLFVVYGIFYRNSPGKHPFVGGVELKKISIGKIANVDKRAMKAIPYGAILSTPAIWAVWLASLGNFFCVNMMFLFSPTYLSVVLGFPVHKTGVSAALPPLAQFLMKLLCGGVSDRIKFFSERTKFRLFNSFAFIGSSVFLFILAFMGVEHKNLNMLVLGCAAACLGATTGGFYKAGPVLSRQFSHFVTGNISLGITITMLIIPFVINGITPDNTPEQWSWVFIVCAIVLLVSNAIFFVFIQGEPCKWTEDDVMKRNSSVPSIKVHDSRPKTAPNQQQF